MTITNNRGLEIKLNRFNQMCNTVKMSNNKTRKERERDTVL
jgi:hypothetical protein